MNALTFNKLDSSKIKYHESRPACGGVVVEVEFENGYTVSVISHQYSYGADNEWELAVMVDDNLVYDTPITDDVIGGLAVDEIEPLLVQISELPPSALKLADPVVNGPMAALDVIDEDYDGVLKFID